MATGRPSCVTEISSNLLAISAPGNFRVGYAVGKILGEHCVVKHESQSIQVADMIERLGLHAILHEACFAPTEGEWFASFGLYGTLANRKRAA